MEKIYTEKIQIYKTNKIAALYPTAKLIIVLLYIVCTLIIGTAKITDLSLPLLLIPEVGILILLFMLSEIPREGYTILKNIVKFAAIILAVQFFLIPGKTCIFRYSFVTVYQEGMQTGISMAFTLINIAGIFIWFFQTTENREMIGAMEKAGIHYKLTYIILSTLQMIDILSQNSKTILNAQKARGIETEGNAIIRTKAFISVLLPLFLTAVIGLEDRALSLETKGFLVQGPKTHLLEIKRSGHESYAVGAAIVITVLILIGRIVLCIRY